MLKCAPVAVLLFVSAVGCNKARPTASDLAGTWVMKDVSRQRLPAALQKASATIVLNGDGTFEASEIPGLFYVHSGHARLESGRGMWTLVSREGGQQVQLSFRAIVGGKKNDVPYGTQLNVSKWWYAVSLYYSLGDPDEGRRVEFERK